MRALVFSIVLVLFARRKPSPRRTASIRLRIRADRLRRRPGRRPRRLSRHVGRRGPHADARRADVDSDRRLRELHGLVARRLPGPGRCRRERRGRDRQHRELRSRQARRRESPVRRWRRRAPGHALPRRRDDPAAGRESRRVVLLVRTHQLHRARNAAPAHRDERLQRRSGHHGRSLELEEHQRDGARAARSGARGAALAALAALALRARERSVA